MSDITEPLIEPVINDLKEELQIKEESIDEPINIPVEPIIEVTEPASEHPSVMFIKNALGQEVPVFQEPPAEFIKTGNRYLSTESSFNVISNNRNENARLVFKYNEKLKMGWISMIDTNDGHELSHTVPPVERIYPFIIDTTNQIVTTNLLEEYPLVVTDEEPTEKVKKAYHNIEQINNFKESL